MKGKVESKGERTTARLYYKQARDEVNIQLRSPAHILRCGDGFATLVGDRLRRWYCIVTPQLHDRGLAAFCRK